MDVLAAARACVAQPGCTEFEPQGGLLLDPASGEPLLSVHSKGAMDVGPLHDWAAANPGVVLEEKLVHAGDKTGFEIDVRTDLLDGSMWEGLRAALEAIAADAYASLHAIPVQQPGAHPDLSGAAAQVAACQGDQDCLSDLRALLPWLDPFLGVGAFQIEVADGGQHEAVTAELASLPWLEPPSVFEVVATAGPERLTRVVGRLSLADLAALQGWLDGRTWTATTRPLTEDELSTVRLQLSVVDLAATLASCEGDHACLFAAGQASVAVVSPGGRLGAIFAGEDPDIEGLNGLEYPGWSMAPPGYLMDGVAGLLSWGSLRDLGLGRWDLGEALSLKLDDNAEITALAYEAWLDAWTDDDVPESWPALPDLDGDGIVDVFDCDPLDADIYSGAPELPDCKDNDCDGWIPAAEFDDWDGDGALACHDCDDGDASRSPGLPESCDGVDNDCSGLLGPDEFDADEDSFRPCDGDCDDLDASAYPGGTEFCDRVDNNCDGSLGDDICYGGYEGPVLGPTTLTQAVTWILDYAEDRTTCPANCQASFLGPIPDAMWPLSVQPPPPGSSHLLQPGFPTGAFWLDYLHCREVMASDPSMLAADPEHRYCEDLWIGMIGQPSPYPDLYELAVGTPLNMPLGVNNGWAAGGTPAPLLVSIDIFPELPSCDPTWALVAGSAGDVPEVKLHEFDHWRSRLNSTSDLQEDLRIELEVVLYMDAFDLELSYVALSQEDPASPVVAFTETVEVPASSWIVNANFNAYDWELAGLAAEPAPTSNLPLDLGQPAVTPDGQSAGLNSGVLTEHAMTALTELIEDTVRDRLAGRAAARQLFFRDFVFEANPLLEASEPDQWQMTQAGWTPTGSRSVLAVDQVEHDQTWLAYEGGYSCGNTAALDYRKGIAVIVEAEVADAALWFNTSVVVAEPPGFRSVVLDDALAGEVADALDLDSMSAAVYTDLLGDRPVGDADSAGERNAVLEEDHLPYLLEDFLAGYLAWAYAPDVGLFGCERVAEDVHAACLLIPEPEDYDPGEGCLGDWAVERLFRCSDVQDALLDQCLAQAAWDTDVPVEDTALHMCGSVQGAELLDIAVVPGTEQDVVCGEIEPAFVTDMETGEVAFQAGQCAVATTTMAVEMNLVIYDGNLYTIPGGGCPSPSPGTPRWQLRMGPTGNPGPLWEEAVGGSPPVGVFSMDIQMDVQFDLGVVVNWSVPLRRQDTETDDGEAVVGWDSMEDWYEPMMRAADVLASLDAPTAETAPSARTDITVAFNTLPYDEESETGGLQPVPGSGHIDMVHGTFPWFCLVVPGSPLCGPALTALAANGDIPAGDERTLAGDQLQEIDISDDMPEPFELAIENFAPGLLHTDAPFHVLPKGPDEILDGWLSDDPLEIADNDGMVEAIIGPLMGTLGLASVESDQETDYTIFMSMHQSTNRRRRSMINYIGMTYVDPPANTAVWTMQALTFGFRLDEAGWPTREAVWRAILDGQCDTLDVGDVNDPVVDCSEDVLVDLVGPPWSGGSAGAIWLFRPDPAMTYCGPACDGLWSGAAWKPGRLPPPGP